MCASSGWNLFTFAISVIRASVPKMELDATFEQKNDIAKTVEEELEKVYPFALCFKLRMV